MFTGIIRDVATVQQVEHQPTAVTLQLSRPDSFGQLRPGDSIAVNGVCLTVLQVAADTWSVRLMQETLERTTLGSLVPDQIVNVEQPVAVGDRLDGHIVQGHVDGVATITQIEPQGDDRIFTVTPPTSLLRYFIGKGSVAIDGVSLTIVMVTPEAFTVSLMPYTLEHTNLGSKNGGDRVNIEVDLMAKYVERLLQFAHAS